MRMRSAVAGQLGACFKEQADRRAGEDRASPAPVRQIMRPGPYPGCHDPGVTLLASSPVSGYYVHNLLASRRHASRRPHNLWPAAAAWRERRRPAKPAAASSAPAAIVSSHGAGSAAGLDAIPPRPVKAPPWA